MNTCWVCGKKFADGEPVIPVFKYVVNEKRGDFITTNATKFIHASHLRVAYNR